MDRQRVVKFLVITYLIAWSVQTATSLYMVNNPGQTGTAVFQAGLIVSMFGPFAAAWIAKGNLKGLGWKPKFKGYFKWLIFAAYAAAPLTVIGAALFYLVFPDLFDINGSYVIAKNAKAGIDIMAKLSEAGIDYKTYTILTIVPAVVFAPFINIATAIGEEVGWRGFLYPELNKSLGRAKTWILGGIFWAAFHFPAMLIGGYEYGYDYIGSPWLGLIIFTLFCITTGILEEIVYDKTKCIWYAALLHGSVNCYLTLPQSFANAGGMEKLDRYAMLGPIGTGFLVALPSMILAVVMGIFVVRKGKCKEVTA